MSGDMKAFQQHLQSSRRVMALVGAGLSAASGLPTFRGPGGLWRRFDAMELATPEAFDLDPGLVWQFYSARRRAALRADPNNGHYALAELAKCWGPHRLLTVTQNVDGLSDRAGHPESGLVHLHGNLFSLKCTSFSCHYETVSYADPLTPALADPERDTRISRKDLPSCPACGGLLRPGVVWFGEALPEREMQTVDDFLETNEVDLILVIGMSATVWPAAGYIDEVEMRGGKAAVFNTDPSTARPNGWYFEGDTNDLLPRALERVIGDDDSS